jgi:hypothetical protein
MVLDPGSLFVRVLLAVPADFTTACNCFVRTCIVVLTQLFCPADCCPVPAQVFVSFFPHYTSMLSTAADGAGRRCRQHLLS